MLLHDMHLLAVVAVVRRMVTLVLAAVRWPTLILRVSHDCSHLIILV